jgi:hypothetical protein
MFGWLLTATVTMFSRSALCMHVGGYREQELGPYCSPCAQQVEKAVHSSSLVMCVCLF